MDEEYNKDMKDQELKVKYVEVRNWERNIRFLNQ